MSTLLYHYQGFNIFFLQYFLDSGVETGNDSNDSLVTQHDNLVVMTSVNTLAQTQASPNNNPTENVTTSSGNSNNASDLITPPEATSQESLPGVSESNESTPSNSLVSVNTFNSGPLFSLALVPASDKTKVNSLSQLLL